MCLLNIRALLEGGAVLSLGGSGGWLAAASHLIGGELCMAPDRQARAAIDHRRSPAAGSVPQSSACTPRSAQAFLHCGRLCFELVAPGIGVRHRIAIAIAARQAGWQHSQTAPARLAAAGPPAAAA